MTKRSRRTGEPSLDVPSKKRRRYPSFSPPLPHMSEQPELVTSSGAKLTPLNAGHILTRYTTSCGHDPAHFKATASFSGVPVNGVKLKPAEAVSSFSDVRAVSDPHGSIHCIITLPAECMIPPTSSTGTGYRSKLFAKRNASFELVKVLLNAGLINQDLNPAHPHVKEDSHRNLHSRTWMEKDVSTDSTSRVTANQRWNSFKANLNDRLPPRTPPGANGVLGTAEYPHITTPSFWQTCSPLTRDELWPTLVQLRLGAPHEDRDADCRVMCVLTSQPLPMKDTEMDISQWQVGRDHVTVLAGVRIVSGAKMRPWDQGQLQAAMTFTERIIRAQLNKEVRGELVESKWVIVPMERDFAMSTKIRRRCIAWDDVLAASGPLTTPFDLERLSEQAIDAMATPNSEFARRHYVETIRADLSPSSAHPLQPQNSFLTSMNPLPSLSHSDQPLLECTLATLSKTGSFVASLAHSHEVQYLIPELVHRHSIPASIFRTTSILPTFFRKLDDQFIAEELNQSVFASTLRPELALLALSCPVGHGRNPKDTYQRLEFLGDTLLKLIATVDTYLRYKDLEHDVIQQNQHLLLSNRSLKAYATGTGVVPYIRTMTPKVQDWVPIGWDGARSPTHGVQTLGDKVSCSMT